MRKNRMSKAKIIYDPTVGRVGTGSAANTMVPEAILEVNVKNSGPRINAMSQTRPCRVRRIYAGLSSFT